MKPIPFDSKDKISFPVFELEIETGDIELLENMEQLLGVVDEFWDILTQDFKFWDQEGCPLKFERKSSLLKTSYVVHKDKNCEYQTVKAHLLKFANNKHVTITSDIAELVDLYNFIISLKR